VRLEIYYPKKDILMRKLLFIFCVSGLIHLSPAQTAHQVPVHSTGNILELSVSNTSSTVVSAATVQVKTAPSWVKFDSTNRVIRKLGGKNDTTVTFSFSIDKSAPMGEKDTLTFQITSGTNQTWTKNIALQVSAPATFELYHNYPNPFNPTTIIPYQLPNESKVTLLVYDILGRKIATLLYNETKTAGYYEQPFRASRCASGIYIYQLCYTDAKGHLARANKKMMLLK
jgi:hypothetical protein